MVTQPVLSETEKKMRIWRLAMASPSAASAVCYEQNAFTLRLRLYALSLTVSLAAAAADL